MFELSMILLIHKRNNIHYYYIRLNAGNFYIVRLIILELDMNYPNIQDKFQNRYRFKSLSVYKRDIIIGNNVWIGGNVIILPGVKIEEASQ